MAVLATATNNQDREKAIQELFKREGVKQGQQVIYDPNTKTARYGTQQMTPQAVQAAFSSTSSTPRFRYSSPYQAQIQQLLNEINSMRYQRPPTVDELRRNPYYADFERRLNESTDQAFAQTRARLAAGGDVANLMSSPAAQQFANIQRQAQEDSRAYLNQLLDREIQLREQRLQNALNILSQLGALEGQSYQQALGTFQANAPYQGLTAAQEAELALQRAGLLGELDGQQTLAARQLDLNRLFGEAELTGQYQGQPTLAMQQFLTDTELRRQQLEQAAREAAADRALRWQLANMRNDPSAIETLRNQAATNILSGNATEADWNILGIQAPGSSGQNTGLTPNAQADLYNNLIKLKSDPLAWRQLSEEERKNIDNRIRQLENSIFGGDGGSVSASATIADQIRNARDAGLSDTQIAQMLRADGIDPALYGIGISGSAPNPRVTGDSESLIDRLNRISRMAGNMITSDLRRSGITGQPGIRIVP